MNDRKGAELLEVLAELRIRYPDWRLGQLICNIAGWADIDVWDIEDEQLLAAARAHLDYITNETRRSSRAAS